MKHTKGTVTLQGPKQNDGGTYWSIVSKERVDFAGFFYANSKHPIEEQEANAALIAEAFNTTNEAGLRPQELADQNKELIKMLKKLHLANAYGTGQGANWIEAWELITKAEGRAHGGKK